MLALLAVATPALADTNERADAGNGRGMFGIRAIFAPHNPEVVGKITAINGTTLTVDGNAPRQRGNKDKDAERGSRTTYTINASSAQVFRGAATTTLTSLVVGDTVSVQGTVDGTTVTATSIRTGVIGMGNMLRKVEQKLKDRPLPPAQAVMQGNGQPVVAGTVTAQSGSTLTLTNKGNVSYAIDAASATVIKRGATTTLASVIVGDSVVVQGTINGTAVTASTVVDHGVAATSTEKREDVRPLGGIFKQLGGMFSRMFGFF